MTVISCQQEYLNVNFISSSIMAIIFKWHKKYKERGWDDKICSFSKFSKYSVKYKVQYK